MSDYLQQIEEAYSRCRGKWSMLSAVDFQLALTWEEKGIPVFIVLRAIDDCCKKYKARRTPGTINTLRYFEQAVDQHFKAWQASRVGAHDPAAPGSEPEQNLADAAIERLEEILAKFTEARSTCPDALRPAIALVIDQVFQLLLQIEGNGDATNAGHTLSQLAADFDQQLLAATPHPEKHSILADLRKRHPEYTGIDSAYDQLLIKELYDRLNLPRLSLFEI